MLQLTKKNDLLDLIDDVLDENNPFNNKIKTEDIYIEDNLFDDTHSQIDQDVLTKWTKKKKKIPNPNSVRLASNRIIKKYRKQRQKGSLKRKQIKNLLSG